MPCMYTTHRHIVHITWHQVYRYRVHNKFSCAAHIVAHPKRPRILRSAPAWAALRLGPIQFMIWWRRAAPTHPITFPHAVTLTGTPTHIHTRFALSLSLHSAAAIITMMVMAVRVARPGNGEKPTHGAAVGGWRSTSEYSSASMPPRAVCTGHGTWAVSTPLDFPDSLFRVVNSVPFDPPQPRSH